MDAGSANPVHDLIAQDSFDGTDSVSDKEKLGGIFRLKRKTLFDLNKLPNEVEMDMDDGEERVADDVLDIVEASLEKGAYSHIKEDEVTFVCKEFPSNMNERKIKTDRLIFDLNEYPKEEPEFDRQDIVRDLLKIYLPYPILWTK